MCLFLYKSHTSRVNAALYNGRFPAEFPIAQKDDTGISGIALFSFMVHFIIFFDP